MSNVLSVQNRQRVCSVDTRLLKQITGCLLKDLLQVKSFELGLHLVAAGEMARVNRQFLQHEGSTDVITFDHSELVAADVRRLSNNSAFPIPHSAFKSEPPHLGSYERLHGELFTCLDDAVAQARQFRTTWQSELVRYVVHGALHLLGHDDSKPALRRRMKLEENRLLRALARRFPLSRLARKPKLHP
jgi:probable rRNA maturation factor